MESASATTYQRLAQRIVIYAKQSSIHRVAEKIGVNGFDGEEISYQYYWLFKIKNYLTKGKFRKKKLKLNLLNIY